MKIPIDVREARPDELVDPDKPRLVHTGPMWDEDQSHCIHGEKMRWTCEDCNAYFANLNQNENTTKTAKD